MPEAPSEPEEDVPASDGEVVTVPCRDRARLMGELSARLMDMQADYAHGLTVRGRDFSVNFSPSPVSSAVRVCAAAEKSETARELAVSAQDMIKALDL
jgi:hypothetical protein